LDQNLSKINIFGPKPKQNQYFQTKTEAKPIFSNQNLSKSNIFEPKPKQNKIFANQNLSKTFVLGSKFKQFQYSYNKI